MTRYSLGTFGLDRRGWYVMRAPQSMQYLLTRLVRGTVCTCPAGICVLLRGRTAERVGGGTSADGLLPAAGAGPDAGSPSTSLSSPAAF